MKSTLLWTFEQKEPYGLKITVTKIINMVYATVPQNYNTLGKGG